MGAKNAQISLNKIARKLYLINRNSNAKIDNKILLNETKFHEAVNIDLNYH